MLIGREYGKPFVENNLIRFVCNYECQYLPTTQGMHVGYVFKQNKISLRGALASRFTVLESNVDPRSFLSGDSGGEVGDGRVRGGEARGEVGDGRVRGSRENRSERNRGGKRERI